MRRFALLALILDTLAGSALMLGVPLISASAPPDGRYVLVNETCLEMVNLDARHVAGQPVADALCATS